VLFQTVRAIFSETRFVTGIARQTASGKNGLVGPVNPRPPRGEFLSTDEFIGAMNALSPDDKLKLHAIESIRRRATGFGEGELLQEAICRTLLGSRNCPREVPLMAFLVNDAQHRKS
jgi:hypothetical protein